jgi:hypothetical protein
MSVNYGNKTLRRHNNRMKARCGLSVYVFQQCPKNMHAGKTDAPCPKEHNKCILTMKCFECEQG